jgi:hypothetical protein
VKPGEDPPAYAASSSHLPEPVAVVAWNGSVGGAVDLASDSDSFEAFLPREPHGVSLSLAALLAAPTPTPTPQPSGQIGCHRWRYALRWERPSRLAILKNVLGNSVTTYTDYAAPGAGNQADWPDPKLFSEIAGAWDPTNPALVTTGGPYDHQCNAPTTPVTPCQAAGAQPNIEGEVSAPIFYSKGTWDFPDPNSQVLSSTYDPTNSPVYHPGADTTGSLEWEDGNPVVAPPTWPLPPSGYTASPYLTAGTYDGWAWTLDYGYAAAPNNDIIYGPDPGPPLVLMNETLDPSGFSIPGTTGSPILIAGFAGSQPTWTTNLPADVVGLTANAVNWGLNTFNTTGFTGNYNQLVPIPNDTGDVSAIEEYMRLKIFNTGAHPGLAVNGGTPTRGALQTADTNLTTTWGADPKKACNRAYGVILCTDGASNVGNTGSPADLEWDSTTTPCAPDVNGLAYGNFPPADAENMYLDAHVAGAGDAIVRARTFVIGISSDISRYELNRTAYRGRTDANAALGDAGFVLFDPGPPAGVGDTRLPHISPSPETAGTSIPTDESGPSTPASLGGFNRFGADQTPPDNLDYAFFASDSASLTNSFLTIVEASANGDYTTSAPVSAAAVSLGNTVILTSTRYPGWKGHIKALDVTNPTLPAPLWDAGNVLETPTQPWQPTPASRNLYTWDPATGGLIALTTANAGAINALCGSCGINASVIDFIRGNDGTQTNTKRQWLLGPSINVTPAIVGPAQVYFQTGNVVNHKVFEATYVNRRKMAWLGADDGFLHGFDLDDGAEVLGLMPPNLIADQKTLYTNFLSPTNSTPTGQDKGFRFDQHTWGIASSLRFADVWFGPPTNSYKTVGYVTEGPGGDVLAAIDITHAFPGRALSTPAIPADPNYDPANPVQVLWTKSSSDYAGLFGTWSVPAIGNNTFSSSVLTFGAGIDPTSLYTGQQNEKLFVVDPTTGALLSSTAVSPLASPSPLVGDQMFADSIVFQTDAPGFQNDNIVNLSVQVDENGRANALWGNWSSPSSGTLINLNAAAGGTPQPLYYSPAVNGIGTLGCQVYALGSGSFYETSPTVSGWNVNRSGAPPSPYPSTLPSFTPTLFVATNPVKITDPTFATVPLGTGSLAANVISKVIGGETTGIPLDPTSSTYAPGHTRLGIHTQITSSPLLVGNASSSSQEVLFTVYDPDYGCNGFSYIIIVKFTLVAGCGAPVFDATVGGTTVIDAGAGAASGFVVTQAGAFVGQSGVGAASSTLISVAIPTPSLPGAPNFVPLWWKQQK